ncbi:efflux RND transporter periplasmic adaptor subunit [Pseudomonas sp. nanlin1]|uniref:efflux RND transporter periplasmic adaptor subunit n=1 Tax=Pseudomonas sp. nanlin1 TaxID=3040605 RepID=UPI003890E050
MGKKSTATLVAVCALALAGAFFWWRPAPSTPNAVRQSLPVPVRVVQVAQQDVIRTLSGIGSVLSLHSVTIRPQLDGQLIRIWVREGQQVKKGEMLASIDDRSIQASLEQARAQLAQSQAQLQSAGYDLKRYKLLSTDNGVSRQTLDQQQALYDQLKASVLGNQAAINAAQVQLSYTQIRSPVAGRVGIRSVDEGNFLRVSDTQGLFSVTQVDPIGIEFSLPQQALPTLQALLDSAAPAVVRAYVNGDQDTGQLVGEGHLTLIDNQISATTGTLRAKAVFNNPSQALWPGQLVSVTLQVATERQALVVPLQVVQSGIDGHYVYRVVDNRVESVPVNIVYQDSHLNIISGVSAGDQLVSDGQSRLKPGVQVEVVRTAEAAQP